MKPKSAEEWRGYIATAVSGIVSLDDVVKDDVVKRVQLDAWNAAIRTAADIIGKTRGCVFKDGLCYVDPQAEKESILSHLNKMS